MFHQGKINDSKSGRLNHSIRKQYCLKEQLIMKVKIIEEKAYLLTVARVLELRELANPSQSSMIKCAKYSETLIN